MNLLCPKCKKSDLIIGIETEGGCQDHGSDEYCYCNSLDIFFTIRCTNNKTTNKKRCDFYHRPYELGDRSSICRNMLDMIEKTGMIDKLLFGIKK